MSKYKCDCGGKLELIQEMTYNQIKPILSNGKLAKRQRLQNTGVSGASYLKCIECDKEYEYYPGVKGRFIKGDERL